MNEFTTHLSALIEGQRKQLSTAIAKHREGMGDHAFNKSFKVFHLAPNRGAGKSSAIVALAEPGDVVICCNQVCADIMNEQVGPGVRVFTSPRSALNAMRGTTSPACGDIYIDEPRAVLNAMNTSHPMQELLALAPLMREDGMFIMLGE